MPALKYIGAAHQCTNAGIVDKSGCMQASKFHTENALGWSPWTIPLVSQICPGTHLSRSHPTPVVTRRWTSVSLPLHQACSYDADPRDRFSSMVIEPNLETRHCCATPRHNSLRLLSCASGYVSVIDDLSFIPTDVLQFHIMRLKIYPTIVSQYRNSLLSSKARRVLCMD